MIRTVLIASALIAMAGTADRALAGEATPAADRLIIVNGNTGHVVFNDGYDDLICVTHRYVAYYNYWGRPMVRRSVRCR